MTDLKRSTCRSFSRKLSHQENVLFFLDSQSEADDSGLLFDMTPFKAIGEVGINKISS